jgi:predicted RecA/RadA family phage recombinase
MERLNEEGQWIILMGILVCVGLFFLAFVINQSTLVGQTTAEGVLEFPKNEIQDTRDEVCRWINTVGNIDDGKNDMRTLALYRKNAVISIEMGGIIEVGENSYVRVADIRYNNGVTIYDEINHYCIRP